MKRILPLIALVSFVSPCIGSLLPYNASLEKADAVAIITVTSVEQSYHDGYFEEYAGSHNISVSQAIELLKSPRKEKKPNQPPLRTPASGTPAAVSSAEAAEAKGAPVAPPSGAAGR